MLKRHLAALIPAWILLLVSGGFAAARAEAPRERLPELTAQEQTHLAEQFAPILVFHSEEQYFPTNPLFPLRNGKDDSWRQLLGTPRSRIDAYRKLPIEEKARLSTVYFRAYSAWNAGEPAIILEYWLYYVQNDYRVRGNILPFWMNGDHPNDLEHIHLVLRAETVASLKASLVAEGGLKFVVDEAYASAHEGKIPANRYKYSDTPQTGRTRFLVELGSHALAPDIDEDGVFTPGKDGDSGAKIQWGIRDRGYTWPRYHPSYMNSRSDGNAVILAHETSDRDPLDSRFSYQLVPVEALQERFSQLTLTPHQRKYAFENQVFWFKRVFGKDNGRSDKLLMPAAAVTGDDSIGLLRASSSERRLLVGSVLNLDEPGFFAGGRYAFLTRSVYLPDLMFQIDGIVTRRNQYLSPQVMLSYPIDGFTRIMAGRSLITDSLKFDRRQWDWLGVIEVRLGNMRISATTRSVGAVRNSAKEFRLFYGF